jgi:hypothetical protein
MNRTGLIHLNQIRYLESKTPHRHDSSILFIMEKCLEKEYRFFLMKEEQRENNRRNKANV